MSRSKQPYEPPCTKNRIASCTESMDNRCPAEGSLRTYLGRSGGSVFHERSYIHELHGRSDAIKLGHSINQLLRKECLRRLLRIPDIEIERFPVNRINREGL